MSLQSAYTVHLALKFSRFSTASTTDPGQSMVMYIVYLNKDVVYCGDGRFTSSAMVCAALPADLASVGALPAKLVTVQEDHSAFGTSYEDRLCRIISWF